MESLSELRVCESHDLKRTLGIWKNALFKISSDMLHHSSTCVSIETRMWSLPTCLWPPPPAELSRSACQISHQWLHFSTSNSMAHVPRVAVLLCCIIFVMKCFYIVERSRRLQLKPLWLLSNKQLCKWRKKTRHFVNKNSLSYSIWLILTILLPHTGSHMI